MRHATFQSLSPLCALKRGFAIIFYTLLIKAGCNSRLCQSTTPVESGLDLLVRRAQRCKHVGAEPLTVFMLPLRFRENEA